MTARRRTVRLGVAAVVAALTLLVAGAVPASAHIVVDRAQPNPDGTTTIVFAFDHGCDLDPTVEIEITLPDGVEVVATEAPEGWSSWADSTTALFAGPPIPSFEPTELSVTATISGTPGDAIHFPTVQRCEGGGTYEWVDGDGGEHPAPTLIVTAALVAPPPDATAGEADGASRGQVLAAIAAFAAVAAVTGAFVARRPTMP